MLRRLPLTLEVPCNYGSLSDSPPASHVGAHGHNSTTLVSSALGLAARLRFQIGIVKPECRQNYGNQSCLVPSLNNMCPLESHNQSWPDIYRSKATEFLSGPPYAVVLATLPNFAYSLSFISRFRLNNYPGVQPLLEYLREEPFLVRENLERKIIYNE